MKFTKYYDRRVGGTGDPGVGGGRHQAPHASTIIHMAAHSAPFSECLQPPATSMGLKLRFESCGKTFNYYNCIFKFFFFSGKFKSLDAQAALNQHLWGGIQAFVFF